MRTEQKHEQKLYDREHPKPNWLVGLLTGLPVIGPVLGGGFWLAGWVSWFVGWLWGFFKLGAMVLVLAIVAAAAWIAWKLGSWVVFRIRWMLTFGA